MENYIFGHIWPLLVFKKLRGFYKDIFIIIYVLRVPT